MEVLTTFPQFLQSIQQYEVGEIAELANSSDSISGMMGKYFRHFGKLMPAVYILDYTQKKYVYASSKMSLFIDYPLSYFLDGGLDFAWKIFHQNDLKVYSERVLIENLNFLKTINYMTHSDYLFTCNYRFKNKKGYYKQLIQQSIFIKSEKTGLPLAALGFMFDYSAFKADNKIYHTIEAIIPKSKNQDEGKLLLNNTYFPHEENTILSVRELEVFRWICEGLKSGEIAAKLGISIYTVNNHRRHILEKTNSRTFIDLVKYGMKQGYL